MADEVGKTYTVSDGELVLTLEQDEDGWFCVTSTMDPELVTQAKSIPEAFEMARDALEALRASREEFMAKLRDFSKAS